MCYRNIENGEILMESSPDGRKVLCLENNAKVAVEFETKSEQCLMSILVEGTAKLVEPDDLDRASKFIVISINTVTGRSFARS
jgi:general stress protein 26